MALAVYQDIFCRMVASLGFRERVLERPGEMLDGLDLTERERRRLLTLAADPGMRVNTAIHRANRLAPLDQTLPFTCFLLGERLRPVVERYWTENPSENLQSPVECERFAAFLRHEIMSGRIADPYLDEVLEFERTCTQLRFYTEEELRGLGRPADGLPALVRMVAFRHDPVTLMEALMNFEIPAEELPLGDFHLLIDCRSGEADFRLIDAKGLAALRGLAANLET
jgi:hypothetical protein